MQTNNEIGVTEIYIGYIDILTVYQVQIVYLKSYSSNGSG